MVRGSLGSRILSGRTPSASSTARIAASSVFPGRAAVTAISGNARSGRTASSGGLKSGQQVRFIQHDNTVYDVLLIGGGVMSSTLGVMLQKLQPDWKIKMVEVLPRAGEESSNGWNNAGTGHSALCELNYTPQDPQEGTINTSNALKVCEQFMLSRQFWSYLLQSGMIDGKASEFCNQAPHLSFCRGEKDIDFLQKRFQLMKSQPVFNDMVMSTDKSEIAKWAPIMMEGRDPSEKVAMTKVAEGSDMNFGILTKKLADCLEKGGAKIRYNTEVANMVRDGNEWIVSVQPRGSSVPAAIGIPGLNLAAIGLPDPLGILDQMEEIRAKFVFVGAGGFSLNLMQLAQIPEIEGYGGFPISGKFLSCDKPDIVNRHVAKVYGKAAIGAPPMSVPHLDIRYLDGRKYLLFGPYAGFAPNFTKESGSPLDLLTSINPWNSVPMAAAGAQNLDLSIYLAKELAATHADHMRDLRQFFPNAKDDEWSMRTAGQRVQIMKKDNEKLGKIQFGTEIIKSKGLAGLMGASPGASVSVSIANEVLEKCFGDKYQGEWKEQLVEMMPGHGQKLNDNPELCAKIKKETAKVLGIDKDM